MIIAALTGSIAMGKSEVARMFASRGIPVFDSDAAVHQLYAVGGEAVPAIARLAPDAVTDGAVDRAKLATLILADPTLIRSIERIVHPLVRGMQSRFMEASKASGTPLVVLDIPLLFETGREAEADCVIVVSTSPEIQRHRALKRPGMTSEKLDYILSRQVPDAEKRARAQYIIDTSGELKHTAEQVDRILDTLLRSGDQPHVTGNHSRH